MEIKKLVQSLIKRYGTHDPFKLAKELGIIVIPVKLVDIRGYYQYKARRHIVYINNELDEFMTQFVCAHELGHIFLHRNMNRAFMDTYTLFVTNRYEIEANKFAVDLLFDDDELQEYLNLSLPTVAERLRISYELAEYRMSTVQPSLFHIVP